MNKEELKKELAHLKEMNRSLVETIVEPGINRKVEEFLECFEDYFRERGFVIRKKNGTVRVSFDTLHFKAFANEVRDIFIMKGKEQIAVVKVRLEGEHQSGGQGFGVETPDQLEAEIEKETARSNVFQNPVFYYSGSEFGSKYETPLSVLDSIFGV